MYFDSVTSSSNNRLRYDPFYRHQVSSYSLCLLWFLMQQITTQLLIYNLKLKSQIYNPTLCYLYDIEIATRRYVTLLLIFVILFSVCMAIFDKNCYSLPSKDFPTEPSWKMLFINNFIYLMFILCVYKKQTHNYSKDLGQLRACIFFFC